MCCVAPRGWGQSLRGSWCPLTALCLLLLPDKQSSSAPLETLLALLQAEGAKIEEDTEVTGSPGGHPRLGQAGLWAEECTGQGSRGAAGRPGLPVRGACCAETQHLACGCRWLSYHLSGSAGWVGPVATARQAPEARALLSDKETNRGQKLSRCGTLGRAARCQTGPCGLMTHWAGWPS